MNLQKALAEHNYELTHKGTTWETWKRGNYQVMVGIDFNTVIIKNFVDQSLYYTIEFHNYHNQPFNVINAISSANDTALPER